LTGKFYRLCCVAAIFFIAAGCARHEKTVLIVDVVAPQGERAGRKIMRTGAAPENTLPRSRKMKIYFEGLVAKTLKKDKWAYDANMQLWINEVGVEVWGGE